MELKIFTKEENENLEKALNFGKELEEEGYSVQYFDLDTADSSQLTQIFDIFASPAFVITQDDGREVFSWKGTIPPKDEVKNLMRR